MYIRARQRTLAQSRKGYHKLSQANTHSAHARARAHTHTLSFLTPAECLLPAAVIMTGSPSNGGDRIALVVVGSCDANLHGE